MSGDDPPENSQAGRVAVVLCDPNDQSRVAFDQPATIRRVQEQVEQDWAGADDGWVRRGPAASYATVGRVNALTNSSSWSVRQHSNATQWLS